MAEPKDKLTNAKAEYEKKRSAEQRAAEAQGRAKLILWAAGAVIVVAAVIVAAVVVF